MNQLLLEDLILGVDEVGLGSLAGPLIVCAVLATRKQNDYEIKAKDSKTYGKKGNYYTLMPEHIKASQYIAQAIVTVSPNDICKWGYSNALGYAFRLSVGTLRCYAFPRVPYARLDGDNDHKVRRSKCYVKGDALWPTISLASCIAKTRQLEELSKLHKAHPHYHFDTNAGYGTQVHLEAIMRNGALANNHRISVIRTMACLKGSDVALVDPLCTTNLTHRSM